MTLAHVMGLPVEETVMQVIPLGAGLATVAGIALRAKLGRLRHRTQGGGGRESEKRRSSA